jgi:polyphosphate:AMP phosphotransferase
MFESAELGHSISRERYRREEPELRAALLDAQFDLWEAKRFPLIILIGGVDGAGKGETLNLLNEWMDPRHIHTHAMGEPSDEERARPPMWRFWRALPPRGKIGIFLGSWYTAPIVDRVMGGIKRSQLEQSIAEIVRFEKMLADEGALLVKFWFHLSKDAQRRRLKALERDPETRWRVTPLDWKRFKRYDKFRKVSEHTLRETSSAEAPWIVIEGAEPRYRSLTAGNVLLAAMRKRLAQAKDEYRPAAAPPLAASIDNLHVLRALEMTKRLPRKAYERDLEKYQGRLNLLTRHPKFGEIRVIAVFEGNDAAGKGGAIRRVCGALDARQYRVVPVAEPTEEEQAQPYLWRFWRHIPRLGGFTIFDRSWYGRVLVERVDGLAQEVDWMRAYAEINDFEEQLARYDTVLVKFWLSITKEEQLRRFRAREKVRFKRFKITQEDWRNRKKWDQYERAVCDMVDRTSTAISPWTLVEANDKLHARIKVLKTLCDRIEEAL